MRTILTTGLVLAGFWLGVWFARVRRRRVADRVTPQWLNENTYRAGRWK